MRRILLAIPLLALLAAVGCNHWPWKPVAADDTPHTLFRPNAETKASDLVAYLNENARKVPGLYCKTVYIDAKQGSQAFGLDAQMACERPRNFRMKAKVAGAEMADFGSNQDEFWYWIGKSDPPYVFHGNYEEMKTSNRVQLPIPFQPDLVIAALGIGELDPNAKYDVRSYKDTLELIEPTTSIQGKPIFKVTVFNRGAVTATKPQVLAYLLKDEKGNDIAIARVVSTEVNRDTRAVLPKSIHLTLIPDKQMEKIEMKMVFDNLQVMSFDKERRATTFALRDAMGDRQGYDLARGALDAPGSVGAGMSIQRTNGANLPGK